MENLIIGDLVEISKVITEDMVGKRASAIGYLMYKGRHGVGLEISMSYELLEDLDVKHINTEMDQ